MANFFTDNNDIATQFRHLDLEEIAALRERDYAYAKDVNFAPDTYRDARDNYRRVLETVGGLAADFIAPLAEGVDIEGSHLEESGRVKYAAGIKKSIDALARADLMGFTLPYRFGGINMPMTVYSIAIELVSRADASLMNIFGLQEIATTLNEYGSEEQKQRVLPRMCTGEWLGAMVLTEPDAGSDLQAVQLRAARDEATGRWHLNGVKRFITNGCAKILLVLARSEPGTRDGRGLSMFLVENDESVWIRRTENKLGIHGSPTCEMQFNNTPAELVGRQKFGLIKYVMSLMNGARLGISAQGIGIAEAAFQNALDYAKSREQFGKAILKMPPIYDILAGIKTRITAARALLYETSRVVDIEKCLDEIIRECDDKDRVTAAKDRLKNHKKLADTLTSMSKFYSCELANEAAYQGISVMGGSGYMRDYAAERYFRDARITNIYEGTTQMQVVACIGGLLAGVMNEPLERLLAKERSVTAGVAAGLGEAYRKYLEVIEKLRAADADYRELHQQRCVEMAAALYTTLLLAEIAERDGTYLAATRYHANDARLIVDTRHRRIMSDDRHAIELHPDILHL